jgi:hypothetical protein
MANIKRGDIVTLNSHTDRVWIKKTRDELDAERAADAAMGRWCDDGGEPILYGTYKGFPHGVEEITVTVTSMRGKWDYYRNAPKFLRTGFCDALKCDVLFTWKNA